MTDVLILAATPAGLAAALAAARCGASVLVLERSAHIGGLPANGLGITDIVTRAATGGIFSEFIAAVAAHYHETYGAGSEQVACSDGGYRFEPHVAEMIFEKLVAAEPRIRIQRRQQFDAHADNVEVRGTQLAAIWVRDLDSGARQRLSAQVFIDATYEGDLAAAAGVPYRIGREGRNESGEPGAGRQYWEWASGRFLAGSDGCADGAVQAYNYRICLTKDPSRRVPIPQPADYRRADYLSIVEDVRSGRLQHGIYRYPRAACAKPVPIPNDKFDTNDHPKSLISTDLPEENWPYPDADWAWRDRFAQRLRDYELGLLWFCQHDAELPADFRADARQWGLARDEFIDNGHFPRQLYVREARRIRGEYDFSALDCIPPSFLPDVARILTGELAADPTVRPPLHADSITASHYPIDSHACRKRETGRTQLDGYFAFGAITRPYQVPYGVIVPQHVDGLLVPVSCSATHLGYGTLRMEPCWMALGQAAGAAAQLAIASQVQPRQVDVQRLQSRLLEQRAVLIYVADVLADDPDFGAVQQLGLHGLFPRYAARLDEPLAGNELQVWRELLPAAASLAVGLTRRAAVRQLAGR